MLTIAIQVDYTKLYRLTIAIYRLTIAIYRLTA